jgi:hypothetical protein
MRSLLLFSLALSVVASPAVAAGKVKAKFACKKVLKDGSSWDIGKEGYKIEAERIDCSVQSKDSKLVGGMAVIKTAWTLGGVAHEGTERNGSPIAEGGHYEYDFTLDRGTEWETCASEITIPVKVTDTSGKVVFEAKEIFKQDCPNVPTSPPAKPAAAPAAAESSRWEAGALEQIPEAARGVAQTFVDAAVDSDPPSLGQLASKGVKKGKKTLKSADVYDLTASTGIGPFKGCDAAGAPECTWGLWAVVSKGASEFWIYSQSDSGYGTFACAVFTKKGEEWRWTAVRTYDVAP